MKHPIIDRVVILLLFASMAKTPASALSQPLVLGPKSTLSLSGDSTLHPFTSQATQMQLAAQLDGTIFEPQALKQFDLSIPVNGLKSKESGLDKNMYKALNAEACPSINFHMTSYAISTVNFAAAESPVRASGTLSIACHEQPVTLEGTLKHDQGDLRLQGDYQLQMTDYGIKPPTLLMGAIRVKNPVAIHFDLRLK